MYQTNAVMKLQSTKRVLGILIPILYLHSSCKGPLFLPKMENREFYQVRINDKIGFINERGKLVIPAIYDTCVYHQSCASSKSFFGTEYGIIRRGNKFGAINSKGQLIIEPQYDDLEESPPDHFRAKKGNKWTLIDLENRPVFPFIFDNYDIDYDDTVSIGQSGKDNYLLYTLSGIMKKTEYEKIGSFSEGFAEVKIHGKTGFIDTSGNVRIEAKYEDASFFIDGLSAVKWQGKWGYIDTSGKMIIEAKFKGPAWTSFRSGMNAIEWQGKWGIINKQGNFIIPPIYDFTLGFDGLYEKEFAIIHMKDSSHSEKKGLINRKGEMVIPPIYAEMSFKDYHVLYASKGYLENGDYDGGLIFLNRDTSYVPFPGHYISRIFGDRLFSRTRNDYGVRHIRSGKVIVPYIFSSLDYSPFGLTPFSFFDSKKNKYFDGYMNKRGKIIWVEEGISKKDIYPGGRNKFRKHH